MFGSPAQVVHLQKNYSALQQHAEQSGDAVGSLVVTSPRFWSNPFHKAFNGAYLACSLMEQSQFSVKLCRFRA